jgi:CBS domain containing-hemolysin-like protein
LKQAILKVVVYENSDDIGLRTPLICLKTKSIKAVVIPVEFVPETIYIKDVMNLLTKKRKSVAVVLDEYGGTSGITIEDIVEELLERLKMSMIQMKN